MGRSGVRAAVALLASGALVAGCGGGGGQRATTASSDPAKPPLAAKAGAAAITVADRARIDARTQDWTLRTPALEGDTQVRILLPRDYDAAPDRRYPVLYLLHGADSDYRSWTEDGGVATTTAGAPLIVVMPGGGAQGWYTDWYVGTTPVQPLWETFHVGELVPWIDAHFRTIADRGGRAIAGLSMGGYGALSYAARHPQTFAVAASFSGALEIGAEGAWGSRSEHPERWRAHLPIDLASRLRSLKLLELRTGDGDPGPLDARGTPKGCPACRLERFLHPSNVRLHERLRRLGIAHIWDDYGAGTHSWPYWRRDLRETLPAMLRALAPAS